MRGGVVKAECFGIQSLQTMEMFEKGLSINELTMIQKCLDWGTNRKGLRNDW